MSRIIYDNITFSNRDKVGLLIEIPVIILNRYKFRFTGQFALFARIRELYYNYTCKSRLSCDGGTCGWCAYVVRNGL